MSFIKNFLTTIPTETKPETKPETVSEETEESLDWLLSCFDNIASEAESDIQPVEPSTQSVESVTQSVEPVVSVEPSQPVYIDLSAISETPILPEAPVQTANGNDIATVSDNKPGLTVASYFSAKGFELYLPESNEVIAPVESLAFTIAINYPNTKQFIRFLRDSIIKKTFDFTYSLAPLSTPEKSSVVALSEKLNEFGLISNLFHNKTNGTIKGTISSAPRCINFINGDFMEMYAKCVTVGALKKAAEKYECDYEIYHNVEIVKDNEKHELDIVFRVGKHIFWSEIKSSKFNPDKYRMLGILMGVVPDKLILLAADKSTDAANSISYFYEYYCANISTFKSSLIEMIDHAFCKEDK